MSQVERPGTALALRLLTGTAEDYETIVAASTGGLDARWKDWLLERMDAPRAVLDLACGTGILSRLILDRFPDCHLTGVDLQADYLEGARRKARERGETDRTTWIHSPAEDAALGDAKFDHIVTCYLPKYADRPALVKRLAEWSAPGARLLLQDFAHPEDPRIQRYLENHHRIWLERSRARFPQWEQCFDGLFEAVRTSPWTRDLGPLLQAVGFEQVVLQPHSHGLAATLEARWPA
ncbi:MAG: methyltransferase domain-containing protein [Planctomycetota bacterium]|nr:methyltransferase domain-containing protein [Planctomycetota bacterium]